MRKNIASKYSHKLWKPKLRIKDQTATEKNPIIHTKRSKILINLKIRVNRVYQPTDISNIDMKKTLSV